MSKLVAVQLETCHANSDGSAWYAYLDGEFTEEQFNDRSFRREVRELIKENGAPLRFEFDGLEEVPNRLSKATNLRRYYIGYGC